MATVTGIGISMQEAVHIATDRERWRNTIRRVGCHAEREDIVFVVAGGVARNVNWGRGLRSLAP